MIDAMAALHVIGDANTSVGELALPWIAPTLLVLGLALVLRCVVRGQAARDLRSLWLGLALLVLSGASWLRTREADQSQAVTQAERARRATPLTGPSLAVQAIIEKHCYACHSSQASLMRTPWAFHLDQPGTVDRLASRIYRQVVQLRAMPAGNATHMTEQERQVIARWYATRPKPEVHGGALQ